MDGEASGAEVPFNKEGGATGGVNGEEGDCGATGGQNETLMVKSK